MPMSAPTIESFMYQTMHRQPDDVRRLVTEGWDQAQQAADLLGDASRVFVTGIGTSYHASLVGAWLLREAGLDARAVLSYDFALYPSVADLRPSDAVIVMAHTGVKRYSAEAMARATAAGATVLSVGSQTAQHPGSQLVLRTVEREKSAAYTSSHLTAMTVLAQVATIAGEARGATGTADFRSGLAALPDQIADVLSREGEILPISRDAVGKLIYATGAGPNEATALEVVIKAREAAHATIDALALEQFLHGPMIAVQPGDVAIFINVPGNSTERVEGVASVLAEFGLQLWIVGKPISAAPQATVLDLPEMPEALSPLLAVVPMQSFAYQIATHKGLDPDTFRRDDERFSAALSLVKL
jgi:glucosamine--fructose-6-phosphate aminotransferase (isomerizing)